MPRVARVIAAFVLMCLVLAFDTGRARAEIEVDLALVLAVDVSRSMDPDEQHLQREGYIEAFRSVAVQDTIRKGTLGRIAVIYFEWSGQLQQRVVVPWTLIDGPDGALAFAEKLATTTVGRISTTSISGAIDFGVRLFEESRVLPLRRVIDISGDGPNNTGRPVTLARDEAVAKGIILNGLPFMLKKPLGFADIPNLDIYFEDCVIGGPGAFSVPLRERDQIADATRNKLVREIAGHVHPASLLQRASGRERANCLVGEERAHQQWR